ncbi:rhicadhesin receptor, putative [Medicago truncatula]|uniref:Germin-like protein n=1 Tax=Medicago truncatula TaxID=3880 RepID=G7IML0_MEDTR|nr:rhicadhesin receptor, putative [Medicago truncatula]
MLGNSVCKDPKLVEANDFLFSGLHIAGNTTNPVGSRVTPVFAAQLPGLNTLGISMARVDIAPWGVNPPHSHPRATEIFTVLEGTLEVGFITSNPENRHSRKVLQKGDVFVFPIDSQNPGAITIGNAVFGAAPEIASEVLIKSFKLDKTTNYLLSKF